MSERRRREKQEKREEKEEKPREKREEKGRADWLGAAVFAAILIWTGVVFLLANLGRLGPYRGLEAWPFVLLGAAGILLLEALIRLAVPSLRRPVTGTIVFAIILAAIGLGGLVGWGIALPLAVIAIGLALLVRYLLRRG